MTTLDDRPGSTPVIDQRTAAYILAVLQTVRDGAAAQYKDAQQIAARDHFTPGDRLNAVDPASGKKVGTTSMTDPGPKATITDREAFAAYMAEEDPEAVEESVSIHPGSWHEVWKVLERHAPDLIERSLHVKDWAEKAALDKAAATGDPVPGVEVRQPLGTVTVRLSTEGKEHIRAQIADGSIDALRALPAKERS